MKQEQLQLTGGNFNESRRALDFYPTPKNVTIALLDFLCLPLDYKVWECACGNHAMSDVIFERGYEVIATDITQGDDFLLTHRECDAIITNPPFNLSRQFIEKAVGEAKVVAMLLKSQYWHSSGRLSLFEKHPPTYVLPLTWRPDFLEHERKPGDKKGSPTMEVAWSVWVSGMGRDTIYKPLSKPK